MPQANATIEIRVQDMKAFTLAIEALRSIAALDTDSDDPDTRDRSYGLGAEMAQGALDEIAAMGVPT